MKKNFLVALSVLTLVSFNVSASEIAVLDVEKIVRDSTVMQDIQKKVSKKQEEYQKDVNKKQKALEAEQKKIEGKKNVLAKDALDKEVADFEKKVEDLKQYVDTKQNNLKKASLEAMSKVNDKIKDIISDIAKEKNLDVIVPAAQSLYYKETLDISSEVLTRLNKKITKIEVKFE